jgi:DNA-binding transcriptional regulator LsrR (DeoR family)
VGNLSQQEISDKLGISRFKIVRLLADAKQLGVVRIAIEHNTTATLDLADQLTERFGLKEAQVAPAPQSDGNAEARRAVGIIAAAFLARIALANQPMTVGLGWGRTLGHMADNLVGVTNPHITFVSLMGLLNRADPTQPVDVCVRLAALTSGKANLLPAPFVVDDKAACDVILQQRLVKETLETARRADYAITSVGECRDGAVLFESGLFTTEQIDQLRDNNVVADCCGVFFTADGTVAGIPLNGCTPCAKPNEMPNTDMTLLAGGLSKKVGTLAVLRANFVDRLFVDENLARTLLENS